MTKEDATAIYDETASNERGRLYDEIGEADVAQCNRVVAEAHALALLAVATEAARRERERIASLFDEDGRRTLAAGIRASVGAAKGGA